MQPPEPARFALLHDGPVVDDAPPCAEEAAPVFFGFVLDAHDVVELERPRRIPSKHLLDTRSPPDQSKRSGVVFSH